MNEGKDLKVDNVSAKVEVATPMAISGKLRVLARELGNLNKNLKEAVGLHPTEVRFLQMVLEYPGNGLQHIAKLLHIAQPTASNTLRELLDAELIEKVHPTEGDKRRVFLHATAKGKEWVAARLQSQTDPTAVSDPLSSILSERSETDLQVVNDVLNFLLKRLDDVSQQS